METKEWLRPSMLPKLQKCGHYRPDVAGEAAERGTLIDFAFRDAINECWGRAQQLSDEDLEAVTWAVHTARAYAGGALLVSDERDLKVSALGLTGTADLLCSAGLWSADLKTGQKRDYIAQQAAYALGFMDDHRAKQRHLVFEMVIERTARDIGGRNDLRCRRFGIALLDEKLAPGGNQGIAHALAAVGIAASFFFHLHTYSLYVNRNLHTDCM